MWDGSILSAEVVRRIFFQHTLPFRPALYLTLNLHYTCIIPDSQPVFQPVLHLHFTCLSTCIIPAFQPAMSLFHLPLFPFNLLDPLC